MNEKRPTLPALTGLRFFAALAILWVHFGRGFVPAGPLQTLVARGGVAVSLFFVLSGFVLAYTYATPTGFRGTARTFYRGRIARLYPVYLLGVLAALLTLDPFYPAAPRLAAFVPGLTLTQSWFGPLSAAINAPGWSFLIRFNLHSPENPLSTAINAPGWSLSAEAFFYLLLPPLLPWCMARRMWQLLLTVAACWVLVLTLHATHLARAGWTVMSPPLRLPEFVAGVCTGLLFLRRPITWSPWYCRLLPILTGAAIVLLLAFASVDWTGLLTTGGLIPLWALLLYTLAMGRGYVARLLGHPLLVLLGAASYSLYILHWPIWCALAMLSGRSAGELLASPWYFAGYAVVAVACSLIVHRYVERPLERFLVRQPSHATHHPQRAARVVRSEAGSPTVILGLRGTGDD